VLPLISKLLLLVFLPFILSSLAKRSKGLHAPIRRFSAYTNLILLLMIYTAISSSSLSLRQVPGKDLALLMGMIFLLSGSFYLSGLLLGGKLDAKKALAPNMGHKNCSLCIWLALANFGPLAAIPPTVYLMTQHLFNSSLIFYFNREEKH
jgi:predicted Na+-dependent transporter